MQPNHRPRLLLAVALGLGLCADLLFYGRVPGISAAIYVGLLVIALEWLSAGRDATNRWLGAAALLLAGLAAWRASPFLALLNLAGALGLLLLLAAWRGGAALLRLPAWRIALGTVVAAFEVALRPAPLAWRAAAELPGRGASLRALAPVGRGLLIAVPVLAVFTSLLAAADAVFAGYVEAALSLSLPFDVDALVGHALFVGLFAWAVAGGLAVGSAGGRARADMPAEGDTQRLFSLEATVRFLGAAEALTVLVLVDLLFGAFMLVQGAYLFGGMATLERTGMTFAEYARRGFFELVAVAVLALGLLWGLATITRRETERARRAFDGACGALVLLTLGLLDSALQRMALYESAYGFTELRLYTMVFMGWLGLVLILFMAGLLRERPQLFTHGAAAAALSALVLLNALNPDALIARENLDRYAATGKLDAAYLRGLSSDAAPVLVAALPSLSPDDRQLLAEGLGLLRQDLEAATERDGWQGWNMGRARALEALRRAGL